MMKPIILLVLDGWGISSDPDSDAQARADIPFYRGLLQQYPHTELECAGEAVGLPEGSSGPISSITVCSAWSPTAVFTAM